MAYSREDLRKDFNWGVREGRGLFNGGAMLLGNLTEYRIIYAYISLSSYLSINYLFIYLSIIYLYVYIYINK